MSFFETNVLALLYFSFTFSVGTLNIISIFSEMEVNIISIFSEMKVNIISIFSELEVNIISIFSEMEVNIISIFSELEVNIISIFSEMKVNIISIFSELEVNIISIFSEMELNIISIFSNMCRMIRIINRIYVACVYSVMKGFCHTFLSNWIINIIIIIIVFLGQMPFIDKNPGMCVPTRLCIAHPKYVNRKSMAGIEPVTVMHLSALGQE